VTKLLPTRQARPTQADVSSRCHPAVPSSVSNNRMKKHIALHKTVIIYENHCSIILPDSRVSTRLFRTLALPPVCVAVSRYTLSQILDSASQLIPFTKYFTAFRVSRVRDVQPKRSLWRSPMGADHDKTLAARKHHTNSRLDGPEQHREK